jgi:hypothetical protein
MSDTVMFDGYGLAGPTCCADPLAGMAIYAAFENVVGPSAAARTGSPTSQPTPSTADSSMINGDGGVRGRGRALRRIGYRPPGARHPAPPRGLADDGFEGHTIACLLA